MNRICAILAMSTSSIAFAQEYAIASYTIDGGGAMASSGGSFMMDGTIGQPDTGPTLSGAGMELRGGFWPTVSGATKEPCIADLGAPFGVLNFFDVATFIAFYNSGDPAADFEAPFGVLNFFDVATFISTYNAGCP